jgi:hypothetical protein
MPELQNLDDARQTLRQLAIIALEANRVLYDGLQSPSIEPSAERRAVLNHILAHLTQMREGFMLALRTSDVAMASELRDLIAHLMNWTWLNELGLRWTTEEPLERLGGQVILYQHALIALGILPRLPTNAVTYPHGAYADIPIPATPGQTLTRLEELEKTIWAVSSEPVGAVSRGAVRRTYGFFEATTWLIANHLGNVVGW